MGLEAGCAEPMYTIREAASVTTKTATALRSMVDRGELAAISHGRRGKPRRIPRSALIQAGIFHEESHLPSALRAFQHQLTLFQTRLNDEIDGRLEQLELFQQRTEQDVDRRLSEFSMALAECQRQVADLRLQLDAAVPHLPPVKLIPAA